MYSSAQCLTSLALILLLEQYTTARYFAQAFIFSRQVTFSHHRNAHEWENEYHPPFRAVRVGPEEQECGQVNLSSIRRVFAISDLHTDNVANLDWITQKCIAGKTDLSPGPSDALIVAGDISHELSTLEKTLSILLSELNCTIFFVSGNHEAWIGGKEMDDIGLNSSLQKLEAVKELCMNIGVHTSNRLIGMDHKSPVWIAPIDSWYDGTLTLQGCEDLTSNFLRWPWVDFIRCDWEPFHPDPSGENGKIPVGLTEHILTQNLDTITEIKTGYSSWKGGGGEAPPGLITFSHFLPNERSLPDWKDPQSDDFLRHEWLDHPVPEVSAKFSKVAGSKLIDEQIRSIVPSSMHASMNRPSAVRHLHVFGHSHRPKDFSFRGIRYIHNPLGKPIEREMNMVSNDVNFQLIWDTTTEAGEVPGEQIIRYWEEKGGGLDLLEENMRKNRRNRSKQSRMK
eukprot:CAMPEP_0113556354 /NCGR_PEP_ID=MMETSP0015_2-20120614/17213_1 /TAXON_ID=2838 /ORGANISM="Odontella" /LENGTH=452 /DNA_ID=CAMNT_0000457707 /DNA_START=23 /DNA_END=1381 /DNA_ORIENTATION=+ /assembly_acc=CAM_ASM_000160